MWFADFRYDEGIRIREETAAPTLISSIHGEGNGLSNKIYIIEVEVVETYKTNSNIGG